MTDQTDVEAGRADVSCRLGLEREPGFQVQVEAPERRDMRRQPVQFNEVSPGMSPPI